MSTRLGYAFVLLALTVPHSARAFSDKQIFSDATTTGGGGGRFFTGSPVDGYTCAVCHQGGVVPVVTVRGLPDLYKPGEIYEIQVDWTNPEAAHALNLELVTDDGKGAGLSLPKESSIDASGRCDRKADGDVAAYLITHGARQIVGVSNCGAQTLRFRFRAPDAESVAFAGAVVRTDGSETQDGDGVLELKRILHRGDDGVVFNPNTQCSQSPRSRPSKLALFLWAALSVGLGRRSQRKSRLNKKVPS